MPIYWDELKTWKNDNKIFIETGTMQGRCCDLALDAGYEELHTFEIDPIYYEFSSEKFKDNDKVNCYLGNSLDIMPEVLQKINGKLATYWLDSHFPTGYDINDIKFAPLIMELDIIKKYGNPNSSILVDDVRLFKGNKDAWGMPYTTQDVIDKLMEINPKYIIEFASGFCPEDILVAHV